MRFDILAALFAQPGQSPDRAMKTFMFQMLGFIAIIYFVMLRPKIKEEKAHRERVSSIKRGDRVTTVGGIIGEVVNVKDGKVSLKTGDSKIAVALERISEVNGQGLSRPRPGKKQRRMQESVKKGDTITTADGVIGEVVKTSDAKVTVRSDSSKIVVERERISGINKPSRV